MRIETHREVGGKEKSGTVERPWRGSNALHGVVCIISCGKLIWDGNHDARSVYFLMPPQIDLAVTSTPRLPWPIPAPLSFYRPKDATFLVLRGRFV